jgi:hypothetical protein
MTVWKGKEKMMTQLYGSWEESFKQLFNCKSEVMRKMSNSVVKIDVELKDDMSYFQRFFYSLHSCIDRFFEGCRSYLSIDSTAINGRWNGHLVEVCIVDGHNWIYPITYGAEHIYPTCRAYRKDVHDHHMNQVYAILDVKFYLDKYHSLKWYRSGFNLAIKYDYQWV